MSTKAFSTRLANVTNPLLFILLVFVGVSFSQTCLQPDSAFYQHFPQGDPIDPDYRVVYYTFDNIPNGVQKNQIISGINNWNTALDNGCSKIRFLPGQNPGSGSTLIIKNGSIPNSGASRAEETAYYGDEISIGTIIFNPDLRLYDDRIDRYVLFYDPNVSGYDTIYIKSTMHEIGHLLGLSHYTSNYPNACTQQSRGSSVMNNSCQVNDSENNMATNVTVCDSNRLRNIYSCSTGCYIPLLDSSERRYGIHSDTSGSKIFDDDSQTQSSPPIINWYIAGNRGSTLIRQRASAFRLPRPFSSMSQATGLI